MKEQAPSTGRLTLYFCVAEATFCLKFPNANDAEALLPAYKPFLVKEKPTSPLLFEMTIESNEQPFETVGKDLGEFDCGGSLYTINTQADGSYHILISDVGGQPSCTLDATADFTSNRAALHGNLACRSFGLNNALMIAFAFAGAHHNILLMHSSVTMNAGRGYMFLGKSGTGKSTHSSLWRKYINGSDLLNDDNPAVRFHEDRNEAIVYGTPWSGKTPCYRNLSVPVGAIVRLEQWPSNVIRRETPLQAFASVLSSCSTMIWDRQSYDAIIKIVSRVVSVAPTYHLRCLPDEEAARICHDAVTA